MDAPIAIVLAAGKGTRMKSDLPKVLCEACGRPLVEYVIDSLRDAGVQTVVAVVGYRAELVKERLAAIPDLEFALQEEQLGTGHAVMMCRDAIARHDGPIVVVAGDSPMLQSSSIRALLDDFIAMGFIDTFRYLHKNEQSYSWWDVKTRARERDVGWRIDYFFISKNAASRLKQAFIDKAVYGSDHCPVGITISI